VIHANVMLHGNREPTSKRFKVYIMRCRRTVAGLNRNSVMQEEGEGSIR
jgi:hypothetical protein